jgi:hypothetical protein
MSLVRVLTPDSEVELLAVCSMLEARGVPFFVRSAGLSSLFPATMPVEWATACGFHACRPVIPADAGPAFQGMPGRV